MLTIDLSVPPPSIMILSLNLIPRFLQGAGVGKFMMRIWFILLRCSWTHVWSDGYERFCRFIKNLIHYEISLACCCAQVETNKLGMKFADQMLRGTVHTTSSVVFSKCKTKVLGSEFIIFSGFGAVNNAY